MDQPAQKPAPYRKSNHATSPDPEDTTTNFRQARSITERQWVPGLIDRKLRAVWQAYRREKPPSLVRDIPCHFDSFAPQFGEGGLDVVTHEIELVMALTVNWMNCKLGTIRTPRPCPSSRARGINRDTMTAWR
jgi:hypothetical protein